MIKVILTLLILILFSFVYSQSNYAEVFDQSLE